MSIVTTLCQVIAGGKKGPWFKSPRLPFSRSQAATDHRSLSHRPSSLARSIVSGGVKNINKFPTTVLLQTNAKIDVKDNPSWTIAPVWWKSAAEDKVLAAQQPWPNDPINLNNYPASALDPQNYPLNNVDDPNNFPSLSDPNAGFDEPAQS